MTLLQDLRRTFPDVSTSRGCVLVKIGKVTVVCTEDDASVGRIWEPWGKSNKADVVRRVARRAGL